MSAWVKHAFGGQTFRQGKICGTACYPAKQTYLCHFLCQLQAAIELPSDLGCLLISIIQLKMKRNARGYKTGPHWHKNKV